MNAYPNGSAPPHTGPNRRLVVLAPVLVLLVLAAAVGIGLLARSALAQDVPGTATAIGATGPANVLPSGAVRVGEPDAKVTVRVVMDLQCPACQAFEQANGTALESAVRDGTAAVEYNVISFLDRASTTHYSSRAGNAAFCVANSGVDNFQSWLSTMFVQQPREGGNGLPDSTLIDLAKAAGYTDSAVAECITGQTYGEFLSTKTQEVLNSGVRSTPSVFINGAEVADTTALMTPNGLAPLIAAATR